MLWSKEGELKMTSRRSFIKSSTAIGASMLLPGMRTRKSWAHTIPSLIDARSIPKYVNALPNPLDPSFIFNPTTPAGTHYEIAIAQTQQNILGPGFPDTTVWGYGNALQSTTYPGRSFVVRRDQQINVHWKNELVDGQGNALPHLFPVDSTLHWADPLQAGRIEGPYLGPVPVVSHVHGGNTPADSDGHPDAWFTPHNTHVGRLFNPHPFTYPNDQEAGTVWYHDHALGITRLNVYAGLAGFYIIRDENEDKLIADRNLPTGPYEIPLAIQDRMFTAAGQLFYPTSDPELPPEVPNPSVLPEFFGQVMLVNGKAWPVLDVEPRQYRFRIVNGCDSRFLALMLTSDQTFVQIGTDLGFLDAPVKVPRLLLGTGERADVILDFHGLHGKTIFMRNDAKTPFPDGDPVDPHTTGQVMAFRVSKHHNHSIPLTKLPDDLRPVSGPFTGPGSAVKTRRLLLFEGLDKFGRLQTMLGTVRHNSPNNGTLLWDDPITEQPRLGDVEVWEVYNTTVDAHPIHMHLVAFQVLDRQRFRGMIDAKAMAEGSTGGILSDIRLRGAVRPPEPNETGPKDTVLMYPGHVTRIAAKFTREGEYVWHCHILSHEDHEMMRPYQVVI